MQVLIINLHAAQNVGDAALLEMSVAVLRAAFPEARIVLAMNEPELRYAEPGRVEVVRSFTGLCRRRSADGRSSWRLGSLWILAASLAAAVVFRWLGRPPSALGKDLRTLLNGYAGADLIVSCPGQIFVTGGQFGLPFLVSAYTVAYAHLLGKPLYVMPQSLVPLHRPWEQIIVRRLYSAARLIYVREPRSYQLALEIGLPADRLRLVPDLAFGYPAASQEEAERFLSALGVTAARPRLGITVINRLLKRVSSEVWERYEESVARAVGEFAARYDAQVVFFPQVTGPTPPEDDREGARRIQSRMAEPERAILLDQPIPPGLLKALYGQMDLFVGTRMHSVIFAISMGVPTLLIAYLTKLRGLADMLGLERWTIPLEQVTADDLGNSLEQLWCEREVVRDQLNQAVPALLASSHQVGNEVAMDCYAR